MFVLFPFIHLQVPYDMMANLTVQIIIDCQIYLVDKKNHQVNFVALFKAEGE
jgi:hypothetical protein